MQYKYVRYGVDIKSVEFFQKKSSIAVQIHIYYVDLIDEIISYINNIKVEYDCYISTDDTNKADLIRDKFIRNCNSNQVEICVFENKGRDIAPFFLQMQDIALEYDLMLHIHTKKSLTSSIGNDCRKYLLNSLLGSADDVEKILNIFKENNNIGLVYPEIFPLIAEAWKGDIWKNHFSLVNLKRVLNRLKIKSKDHMVFPAGNMLWFRPKSVKQLFKQRFSLNDFPIEQGQTSDTIMHIIERLWSIIGENNGYKTFILNIASINTFSKNYEKKISCINASIPRENQWKDIKMYNRQHIFDFDINKICIVINVTDQRKYDITLQSLQTINIPEGKTVELCEIFDADTIGAAYNQAIAQSNAKYKIYIREGVKILNKDILCEIIELFEFEYKAGIVGMSGSEYIPVDTNIYKTNKYYGALHDYIKGNNIIGKSFDTGAKVVDALDSLFIATQYDIPWQEEQFYSLYYLTLSQCTEFRRYSYAPMVMKQEKPWIAFGNYTKYCKYENSTEKEIFNNLYYKDVYPLVSILIQTHNRPKYVVEALESAINQTYKNLDIVISDNSDDDATYKIMQEYIKKDSRIRYFYHKGASSVKNNSILCDNIRGEYMSWLMDDDLYALNKIERMIDYYREYDNISLVTSSRKLIDAEGNEISTEGIIPQLNLDKDTVLSGKELLKLLICTVVNYVGEPTTPLLKTGYVKDIFKAYFGEHKYADLFGRKIIAMDMGLRQIYGMGDIMLWMDLLQKGDIAYIKEPLSSFRWHINQDQKTSNMMWWVNTFVGFYLLAHYFYNKKFVIENDQMMIEILRGYKTTFDIANVDAYLSLDILYYKEYKKCFDFLNYELENNCVINVFEKYDF